MENLCEKCTLYDQIEEYREKLNNLIVEKKMSLLDDQIIQISHLLDGLLYKCVFCEKNLN